MDTVAIETRRRIKPGDIFCAHLTTTMTEAGPSVAGMSDVNEVLTAGASMRRAGDSGAAEAEFYYGNFQHEHQANNMRQILHDWEEDRDQALQSDFMGVIHNSLSKEAFIKKLVIHFNGAKFDCKNAVSHWEWQKNSALLELEHQNQQLQHRINDAAKQVLEANARAEYDRKLLAEALQKGKKETHLIGRAGAMRTLLIQRTETIARRQLLCASFFSLWRFVGTRRKKRVLKKAEASWKCRVLARNFNGFIYGCEKIRRKHVLSINARHYCLKKCFKQWWYGTRLRQDLNRKFMNNLELRQFSMLRTSFDRWEEYCSVATYKQSHVKRARKINSRNRLRYSWNLWKRGLEIGRGFMTLSETCFFHRLVGGCFRGWLDLVSKRIRVKQQMETGIHFADTKALVLTFKIWSRKIRTVHVVKERFACLVHRTEWRLLRSLFMNWQRHAVGTRSLRIAMRILAMKVKVWYLRWGFSQLKQRWIYSKLFEQSRNQRTLTTRSVLFQLWSCSVKRWKATRKILQHIERNCERRQLQKSFCLWMVCVAHWRRSSAEEEARKLQVQVKVLEVDLKGAARVHNEMENLVLKLESGRKKLIHSLNASMARNPVWASGFLDVLLRWTVPLVTWQPPPRAGHAAVSLPKGSGYETCTRVVVFGGYNGDEWLNDFLLFDTDEMQWKTLVCSSASSSGIPNARQTHTACAVGDNTIIILGGFDGKNDLSELFTVRISEDGSSYEWSQPPSPVGAKPGPISQHTSCLFKEGRSMVVFGGYRSSVGLLNELWILDLQWMIWSSPEFFGTPPSRRRGHGAAIIGSKMLVFGGFNGVDNLLDLHALDLESMTWELIETQGEVPSPRRQFSVAVVGEHFVVHGGFSGSQYLGDVFSFHVKHMRWNKWPEKETQQSLQEIGQTGEAYGRSMHTMVECGQRLVIFGGVHEFGALQDILFIENASAIEGLQLQNSLMDELEKVKDSQQRVTGCEDALRKKSMELIKAQGDVKELQTTLQMESDKKKKAVQGHQVLSKKLQNSRRTLDCLSQKYHGLRQECEQLQMQYKKQMDFRLPTS
ncbi:hypothetical protein R1sor_027577 [Riccia sorocarpa]|uniref:Uncharacterized protein n=1 Tax=Riccia sorocarpa TaxID=122646 RepID=A0ABD3GKB0_9MARC